MTKALIDDVVLSTANAGGKAKVLMMSNYNKTVASRFLDDADVVPLRKEVSSGMATIAA